MMRGPWWVCGGVVLCVLATLVMPCLAAEEAPLDLPGMAKILAAAGKVQGKPTPKELLKKDAILVKGDYDPNTFLAVFPKLSLEKGKVLDFVYDLQDLGGHAVVYARSADKAPFSNLAEFKKEFPRKYFIGSSVRYDPNYLGSIKAEDSPDGFLQLALLVLTGEQFYIHWHAAYSIFDPVLNRETLADILKDLPENLKKQGGELDITPRVIMGIDEVRVEYVIFGNWMGFKRLTWKVSRSFPHRFIGVEEKMLLEYKNPLRF